MTLGEVKGGYGDFCFTPPDPIFYAGASGRSWKERIYRSDSPPHLVTAGVNSYSHFFFYATADARKARADRRRCPSRPPPRAIRGSIRISGARRVQRAAACPAATTPRPASRGRPSAHGRIFYAAAEASEAARGSPPPLTTAASAGDPRLHWHLRMAARRTRRRLISRRK